MRAAPPDDGTRLSITRESLWLLSVPEGPSQRDRLTDRRGRLVWSGYAVYPDVRDQREYNGLVTPVLRTLAASTSRSMLVLTENGARFDAARVRAALQLPRDLSLVSMVEISAGWSPTMLELLAATAPTYVRLAPEMLRGAAAVPDVFRALVMFAEFARERALELVVRNPLDESELDAIRAAGIGLVQWGALPSERSAGPLPPGRPLFHCV